MEFFDWLSVPQLFIQYFGNYFGGDISTAQSAAALNFRWNLICIIVAAGLFLVGTVFGGIGLMAMAKKRGMKNGWLGFVPFLNTYFAGEVAGEANVFGKKIKHVGLWCMLVEIAFVAMQTFALVVSLVIASNPAYYSERLIEETGMVYYALDSGLITGSMRKLAFAGDVVNIIVSVWWFVLLFFFCALFFALFRKYYARSPFLMTFLCAVLPCRGFVLFAVRNNTPIDYNEYMRKRMEEERRRYQDQYGQGGGNGGYGGGGGSDSPFPDFDNSSASGRDSDGPFSDF